MGVLSVVAVLALVGQSPAADVGRAPEGASRDAAERGPKLDLIDMVVAQVDATVITLSELVAETRLVLLRTAGPEVARAGRLGQGLLDAVLRSVVARELILGEVRRLGLDDVQDEEVGRALAELKARFASNADYERFLERAGFRDPGAAKIRGLDAPPQLVTVLAAELAVERFLDARNPEADLLREGERILLCYEVNRPTLGGRTLDEVRGVIAKRIVDDRRARALEELLAALTEKSTVRYTPGFDAERTKSDDDGPLGLRCPDTSKASP